MRRNLGVFFGVLACLTSAASPSAQAEPIQGTLTYTLSAGAQRLKEVDYSYDGTTFTLGAKRVIARERNGLAGADGVAFDPYNNHILVGGQGNRVYRVNPVGPVVTSAFTGPPGNRPAAFHLSVDPSDSFVWASGIPGALSRVPIGAAFGVSGTPFPVTGSNTNITSLIFTPEGAFYTASGPAGFGSFGTITLGPTSATTVRHFNNLPAAHGGTYDPFTGDVILFGDNHVTQIDPQTLTIVSNLNLATRGLSLSLDQGTVDGLGHLYVADGGGGHLLFIDYSATRRVASLRNFLAAPFLDNFIDDVAPLVGPGAETSAVIPEPASVVVWSLLGLVGVGLSRLRRGRGRW